MVKRLEDHWQRQIERIAAALDLDTDLPDVYDAFDTEDEIRKLAPIMQAHMQRVAETAAWDVLDEWNPDSEGWDAALIEAWIAKAALSNSTQWCNSVEQQLAEHAAKEDPVGQLRGYLETQGPLWMAVMFATEAQSFGRQDAAAKSGLATKTWRTKNKNSRPTHARQNGATVGINDLFPNGLRWPGDSRGSAAETADCSCILEYGRE